MLSKKPKFEHFKDLTATESLRSSTVFTTTQKPTTEGTTSPPVENFAEFEAEQISNESNFFSAPIKKFQNPTGFSFKTLPRNQNEALSLGVTELPKFTYSVETSTSVNSFINFGEEIPTSTQTNVPKYTYKLLEESSDPTEPKHQIDEDFENLKKYTFRFLNSEQSASQESQTEPEIVPDEKPYKKYDFRFLQPNEIPPTQITQEDQSERPLQKYDFRFLTSEEAANLPQTSTNPPLPDFPTKKYSYQLLGEEKVQNTATTEGPIKKFTYKLVNNGDIYETTTVYPKKSGLVPVKYDGKY